MSSGLCRDAAGERLTSVGPDVPVPFPARYGSPPCPACGYRCGCCCNCPCQTPCPNPDEDGFCDCEVSCHGGHEPWECLSWSTRYGWAKAKSAALAKRGDDRG